MNKAKRLRRKAAREIHIERHGPTSLVPRPGESHQQALDRWLKDLRDGKNPNVPMSP